MKRILLIFFAVFIILTPINATRLDDKMNFGISAGTLSSFGTQTPVSFDWYFLNIDNHHLSAHIGLKPNADSKKDGEGDTIAFGGGLFYGYGMQDRLLLGLTYGPYSDTWDMLTRETNINYESSLAFGYQRLFLNGITFHALICATYSDNNVNALTYYNVDSEGRVKYKKRIGFDYSIGVGYYF